ncbi:hypothetical protein JT358_09760 [Micrococcales bacterium 31B]|nr:hypothetical protein [Micrococcales bacterium 31B]
MADELDMYEWGERYLAVILDGSWVHREVESLWLDDVADTTRRISLDATVPQLPAWPPRPPSPLPPLEADDETVEGARQIALPLRWMPKGMLRRFTVSVDGDSVSLLTSVENAQIACSMLNYVIDWFDVSEQHGDSLRELAKQAVTWDPFAQSKSREDTMKLLLQRFDALTNGVAPGDSTAYWVALLRHLMMVFFDNFMMFVVVPAETCGSRRVVKFAHEYANDVYRPSLLGDYSIKYPAHVAWPAGSYHLEINLPSGAEAQSVKRPIVQSSDGDDGAVRASTSSNIAHIMVPQAHVGLHTELQVEVVVTPHKQGLRSFALWVACGFAAMVTGVNLLRYADAWVGPVVIPSPSVSLLLVWPAVMLSWLARDKENNILAELRRPHRFVLLCASALIFVVAAIAAIPTAATLWNVTWYVVNFLSLVLCAFAIVIHRNIRKREGVKS